MKLGFPIILIMCSNWWAFEILLVICGRLGVDQQAAYVILQTIISQLYMTALGMAEATCVIVGNSIGE